jgi:hypothetical protein
VACRLTQSLPLLALDSATFVLASVNYDCVFCVDHVLVSSGHSGFLRHQNLKNSCIARKFGVHSVDLYQEMKKGEEKV